MLDDAFRQVAGAVSATFGGPYHPGLLHYPGVPVKDPGGDIIDPGEPFTIEVEVQVDVVTEQMRQDADFMEKDVRLLILGPAELDTVPEVAVIAGPFAGKRYSLRTAVRDTLGFAWECRARGI